MKNHLPFLPVKTLTHKNKRSVQHGGFKYFSRRNKRGKRMSRILTGMLSWKVKPDLMISSLWGLCCRQDGFELSPTPPAPPPYLYLVVLLFTVFIQFLRLLECCIAENDLKPIVFAYVCNLL